MASDDKNRHGIDKICLFTYFSIQGKVFTKWQKSRSRIRSNKAMLGCHNRDLNTDFCPLIEYPEGIGKHSPVKNHFYTCFQKSSQSRAWHEGH